MNARETLHRYGFMALYTVHHNLLPKAIEYCLEEQHEPWAKDVLDRYERAERGDFDLWLGDKNNMQLLVGYAVLNGRCDIIEKYAPLWPDSHWNYVMCNSYKPNLYPAVHMVMPLPLSVADAAAYAYHGLQQELVVHVIGRKDIKGETITLQNMSWYARSPQTLRNLEEIGLDLSDPMLLYGEITRPRRQRTVITLLQDKCTRLDEIMPNGKTLREMLLSLDSVPSRPRRLELHFWLLDPSIDGRLFSSQRSARLRKTSYP
jgi:hypothetical protein